MPRLHAALLRAYAGTTYRWRGWSLRIGRRERGLDAALGDLRHAALVTAHNPFSRMTPPGRNARAQRCLREAARRHVRDEAVAGGGTRWEEPMLVLSAGPRVAARIGRRFRQHAIVLLRRGAAPRLLRLSPLR